LFSFHIETDAGAEIFKIPLDAKKLYTVVGSYMKDKLKILLIQYIALKG
jgi:hypothetical protein